MKKLLFALLIICPYVLRAQGFQVNLQGQRQVAMGHAGTALAGDASTIFFNPGALAASDTNSILLGVSPIFSAHTYRESAPGTYTATTDNPVGTPFYFYGSFGPKGKKWKAGLGIYTPFGSSVTWGDNWKGRYVLQSIALRSVFIQPTFSYRISDKISIGAGFVYVSGNVHLNRAIPLPFAGDGRAELKGKASGIGFNAGIYVKPTEKLALGLTYRSKVNMEVSDGDATFKVPAAFATSFPAENKFSSSLPLPSVLTFGLSFKPSEKLTLAADVNYVGWSAYDTLAFDYEKDRTNTPGVQLPDTKSAREYKNSFAVRAGVEYMATAKLAARAGIYYGLSPVQSGYLTPETPDANRIGISFGLGYNFGKLAVDASILFVNGMKRDDINKESQFGGTYKSQGVVPGIGLKYSF